MECLTATGDRYSGVYSETIERSVVRPGSLAIKHKSLITISVECISVFSVSFMKPGFTEHEDVAVSDPRIVFKIFNVTVK